MSDSFCDQSSYELVRECRDGVNDLFTAMCQELDDRRSLAGETGLLSRLEMALDYLCGAQSQIEKHTVEELVWPARPVKTPSQINNDVRALAARMRKADDGTWSGRARTAADFYEGIDDSSVQVGDAPAVP